MNLEENSLSALKVLPTKNGSGVTNPPVKKSQPYATYKSTISTLEKYTVELNVALFT